MILAPMDPADATACDAMLVTHEHMDRPSYESLLADGRTL